MAEHAEVSRRGAQAARTRGMRFTFSPAVPQLFAAVDKDKVFKLGISIDRSIDALQTLLGGYYVNQFNRFGRVWKVFVEAEPQYRTRRRTVGQFYVRNSAGTMVPLSTLVNMRGPSVPNLPRASTSTAASKFSPLRRPATARATR